jgi:hypothetical protein
VLKREFFFAEKAVSARLSHRDFTRRFTMRMLTHPDVTPLHGGDFSQKYADKAAASYWSKVHPEGISPEECADDDMSYWGL